MMRAFDVAEFEQLMPDQAGIAVRDQQMTLLRLRAAAHGTSCCAPSPFATTTCAPLPALAVRRASRHCASTAADFRSEPHVDIRGARRLRRAAIRRAVGRIHDAVVFDPQAARQSGASAGSHARSAARRAIARRRLAPRTHRASRGRLAILRRRRRPIACRSARTRRACAVAARVRATSRANKRLSANSAGESFITTMWPMPAAVAPPPMPCASSTSTCMPRAASSAAQAAPTIPAPTIDRIRRHAARMPQANGSRSSKHRRPSAMMCAWPVMVGTTDTPSPLACDSVASNTLPIMLSCRHTAPSAQLAVGGEARHFRARAGAARRAVVGVARTQHEVAAVDAVARAGSRTARYGRSCAPSAPVMPCAISASRIADAERGQLGDVRRAPARGRARRRGKTSCRPTRCRRSARRDRAPRPAPRCRCR